jgi:hypothetical protein
MTIVVHAVGFRHRIPGEGVGGHEWDLDREAARARIAAIGVFEDADYETIERTFTIEGETPLTDEQRASITDYIDGVLWDEWKRPNTDSVWKQAARYGDADAEEHGLEEAIRKQGIDFEEYRHLADQRALRNVLMRRPGFDPSASEPFAVALDPLERVAHVAFMAAYWDGLYIGWRARGLADGPGPATTWLRSVVERWQADKLTADEAIREVRTTLEEEREIAIQEAVEAGSSEQWVIVFTPEQGREYGEPDVVGPFPSKDEADQHLFENIAVGDGYQATVLRVENPNEDA